MRKPLRDFFTPLAEARPASVLLAIVLPAAMLLAMVSLGGCREKGEQPERPRRVQALAVIPSAEDISPLMTGQVAAHTAVNASFRVPGKIVSRMVSAGDRVKRGAVLAVLDDQVSRDTLRSAEAAVAEAEASLLQAEQNARRMDTLYRARSVAQQEQESAVRLLKAARAHRDAALAQRHAAGEQLAYTKLLAPIDGLVTNRYAERGEVVAAGQPVFRMAGNDGRDAVFDMPEALVGVLSVGQTMEICLDRDRDACTSARIEEVYPEADPVTRTYRTRAHLKDPGRMELGAAVVGRVAGARKELVRIPASALFESGGAPAVWIVQPESGQVTLRPIAVGSYSRDEVAVTSGLNKGDMVVTAGVHVLREGQKVEVLGHAAR